MRYCYCEPEVRSSSVRVVYIVCLHIVFSKAALQKRGSMEPMEPLWIHHCCWQLSGSEPDNCQQMDAYKLRGICWLADS